jgi:hypothetical protein
MGTDRNCPGRLLGLRLQWAPVGKAPVVSWDFDVEID